MRRRSVFKFDAGGCFGMPCPIFLSGRKVGGKEGAGKWNVAI
jgi:hypothetical protein